MDNFYNVLVIGAGISGIGAGHYLKKNCPNKSFAIIENRDSIGGTWDLFKYPGIRSDSDMFTLGYAFKPWISEKAIADGPSILEYLNETVKENNLKENINFNKKVVSAHWRSEDDLWKVVIKDNISEEEKEVTCNFLFMCTGYYKYENGYTPDFPGIENFNGQVIHPQHWPENLNYENKKVIVIGSGATAATIVPELSKKTKYVTMLQRSPTYFVSYPDIDLLANRLRKILPKSLAYTIIRLRNVFFQQWLYTMCRKYPKFIKKRLLKAVKDVLPNANIEKDFNPRYNPWEQRMCLVPNGDLFESIKSNGVKIETDEIEYFQNNSIKLKSSKELEADIVITATGLNLQQFGGTEIFVDNNKINPAETMTYKSMMFSGIPNFANSFGYINASWTLKADLTCEFVCKLLNHMDKNGFSSCVPKPDQSVKEQEDWLASEFSSGYIHRAIHLFPKTGDKSPWTNNQNYFKDFYEIKFGKVNDGAISFKQEKIA